MKQSFALLAALWLASSAGLQAANFHVAPYGSDTYPGNKTQPFATITRARDAVRDLKKNGPLESPVEIVIHAGTYFLPETIVLEPQDSGTEQAPIVYRSADNETVVLSGGRRIAGPWKKDGGAIWVADLPELKDSWLIRQLFVDGRREIRARYPNIDATPSRLFGGGDRKDSIRLAPGQVKPAWGSAADAQVHIVPEWRFFNQIQTIISVDPANSLIHLGPGEQHARIIDGSWFFIEGVREELDQPREWHLDPKSNRLYYWPDPNRDPNHSEIIAPRLNRIIHIKGDVNAGTHVQHVHFRNLIFRHTTYTLGHIEPRVNTDAAVLLENASHCRIEKCRFEQIGGYGLWLHLDSCDNNLDSNEITDAGAGGVLLTSARFSYMDDSKLFTPGPTAAKVAPLRNRITRNHIHHCGLIRFYNSGVHLDSRPPGTALDAGNLITHNHIHHMPRNGIFAFRNQGGNIIEFNRIEQIMLETEDGGGIHFATMNQLAAPNRIANNLVANAWGWRQLPSGKRERRIARGIYLDWFTASTQVESNITFNTRSGGLQFNAGDDNHFINNIVIGDSVRWDKEWRGADAQGTVDQRNLVLPGKTASTTSPLRAPSKGDFTLSKDFADYPKDFQWIDVSEIGLTGTATGPVSLSDTSRIGGVIPWNSPTHVEVRGPWEKHSAAGMWGLYTFNYLLAAPKSDASITFTLPIRSPGLYAVRLTYPSHATRATNARVEVVHADGVTLERLDQRPFAFNRLLGRYRFTPDRPARLTIGTTDADGSIAIEEIGFMRADDTGSSPR